MNTTAWHPPTPIEALFTQLEEGTIFATAGGETPSAQAVIRTGYNLIHTTGLFETPCREWRNKATNEKTMTTFQSHFRLTDQDRRLTTTTATAGYHGANATVQTPATPAPAANTPTTTPRTSYCWTHGTSRNLRHNSTTCLYKGDGHQDAATHDNTMGGNTKVRTAAAPAR
jgi:hypothetical protein